MKKYIISSLLAFSIIIPISAFAQADIDPSGSSSGCVSIVNNLRYKARDINTDGEVSDLQDFLQYKNYLNSEPTGYFGLMTFKAVKDFQSSNGISPTGYVGPITRAKIKSITCDTGEALPTNPAQPANPPTVCVGYDQNCNGPRIEGNLPLIITNPSTLPNAKVGNLFATELRATSGRYGEVLSFSLANGSILPPGLSFGDPATIYGKPTIAGTYTFTVQFSSSLNGSVLTASKQFTLTVEPVTTNNLSITPQSPLPSGKVGNYYSVTLGLTSGNPSGTSYSWSLPAGSNLPPGLSFIADFGSISGTPTVAGNYNFTINLYSFYTSQSTSKTFNLTIDPATPTQTAPPTTPTTSEIGLVNPGAITVTAPVGQYTKAFTLRSTTARSFYFYGYPTNYGPGINIAESSGGISPGGQIDIRVQVNSSVPTGTYTGTVHLRTSDSGVTGEITFPITVNVVS